MGRPRTWLHSRRMTRSRATSRSPPSLRCICCCWKSRNAFRAQRIECRMQLIGRSYGYASINQLHKPRLEEPKREPQADVRVRAPTPAPMRDVRDLSKRPRLRFRRRTSRLASECRTLGATRCGGSGTRALSIVRSAQGTAARRDAAFRLRRTAEAQIWRHRYGRRRSGRVDERQLLHGARQSVQTARDWVNEDPGVSSRHRRSSVSAASGRLRRTANCSSTSRSAKSRPCLRRALN